MMSRGRITEGGAGAGRKKRVLTKSAPAEGQRNGARVDATVEHRRIIHELRVRQVELEAQNDALHEAQAVLEQSRARYAELYDAAPVGHVTLDEAGVIREVNLAAAGLLGEERLRLHGRPLRGLLMPASRKAFDAHLRGCAANHEPAKLEVTVRLPDGGARTVELVTIVASHHSYAGATLFHTAILERTTSVREEFLAVVSHELRTPLNPMKLWTKALRSGGASDALRARAVDALDACLAIQVAMIDDLIDVARGQRRQLRVELKELDVRPVIAAVIDALAPSAAAKQIALSLELDREPALVSGDAMRLQQVASNLLLNAFKFTREAGHVDVTVHRRDAHVVLTVRDDGEGIEPAEVERIFDPFKQIDRRFVGRDGGLGLGLAIVRQLVLLHGGSVGVDSAGRGRGATFTVRLPALAGVS
jgi:PAS domain S-box-containing protein